MHKILFINVLCILGLIRELKHSNLNENSSLAVVTISVAHFGSYQLRFSDSG